MKNISNTLPHNLALISFIIGGLLIICGIAINIYNTSKNNTANTKTKPIAIIYGGIYIPVLGLMISKIIEALNSNSINLVDKIIYAISLIGIAIAFLMFTKTEIKEQIKEAQKGELLKTDTEEIEVEIVDTKCLSTNPTTYQTIIRYGKEE